MSAARVAAVLAAGAALTACRHASSGANDFTNAPAGGAADSLAGIVRVVGTDALPEIVLMVSDTSHAITLEGPKSLRRVAGLRITVIGVRSGIRLTVSRFIVLAANGVPATDGTLVADSGVIVLETRDGVRRQLVNPPPLFRANIGHRVWVSGPLDREPVSYGIIE